MGGSRIRSIALAAACATAFAALPSTAAATPGVTRKTIRIGIHGPVTGAVPLLDDSAGQAARVFWRWLRVKDRTINGRNVRVVLRNDNTNPSQAVAVCKEMVEEKRVFALAALPSGLSDQIQACARYAENAGVPYVSLGVGRRFYRGFDRYFAVSKTYPAQARLLADLFVDRLIAGRNVDGIVYSNSPAMTEPVAAFERALERRDADLEYKRSVSHMAGTSEARLVVEELQLAGVHNVFFLHTPAFFLNVIQQAETRSYHPNWTGIDTGIPNHDGIARSGCGSGSAIEDARFLSPIPAFAGRDSFDRRHDRAMQRIYGTGGDTTTWFGWAFSKGLKQMLEEPGRKLTRGRFERKVERSGFRTGVLPRVRFRPRDHFGGRGLHLLRIDCTDRSWRMARAFVTDF